MEIKNYEKKAELARDYLLYLQTPGSVNQRRYENHLADWKNHKLSHITQEVVRKRFNQITETKGGYAANVTLSLISKMFEIAINEKGWPGVNPAKGIKKNKEVARDRFLSGDELAGFYKALIEEPNETARCFFLLKLFCGVRKANMLAMRWDEIDFKNEFWRISDTKNGEAQYVTLAEPALDLLKGMKKKADKGDEWVFPSKTSKSGHFEEPKKAWARILSRAGIQNLRIHDLRVECSEVWPLLLGIAVNRKSRFLIPSLPVICWFSISLSYMPREFKVSRMS